MDDLLSWRGLRLRVPAGAGRVGYGIKIQYGIGTDLDYGIGTDLD